MELEEARARVLGAVRVLPAIAVELDSALGRVLAEDVVAQGPLPAFDSSAMDGFAVRSADLARASHSNPVALKIAGESRAGWPADRDLEADSAIAISTGAIVPAGADAVVRVEHTQARDGSVRVFAPVSPGAEIRHAGEDVRAGERVIARGTALGAAELGMLAALSRAHVRCTRAPLVSVLVTGDELLGPDGPATAGSLRDSNSHMLAALARCAGAQVLRTARLRDRQAEIEAAIGAAVLDSDALIVCGGMSVGAHDHVRPALQRLGAQQLVWGLALKPGHPTWFGTLDGRLVFGLPGNPVSAFVTFALLVAPALAALQGAVLRDARRTAILDEDYRKPAGRAHALRVSLDACDDGWHARLSGPQGSHVLSSMLRADALAIIPSAATDVPAGARVHAEPLNAWSRLAR
jgi:molybdopterin molybdotransferase